MVAEALPVQTPPLTRIFLRVVQYSNNFQKYKRNAKANNSHQLLYYCQTNETLKAAISPPPLYTTIKTINYAGSKILPGRSL